MDVECCDGVMRRCRIRGSLRGKDSRVWLRVHDVVLIGLHMFHSDNSGAPAPNSKGDVIHKYCDADADALFSLRELPESWAQGDDD